MNISGIRPNEGFYENSIVRSREVSASQPVNAGVLNHSPIGEEVPESTQKTPLLQNYDAADYAKEYQPNEAHKLKGDTSDLMSLDTEPTASKAEREQVIRQYQFFVGGSRMQNRLEQMKLKDRIIEDFTV